MRRVVVNIREPAAADRYYPGSPQKLREMLAACIDRDATPTAAWGAYSPHAGYPYSGAVSGATLSRLKLTDTCIILGPNHTGMGKPFSIMTRGAWRTPLGEAAIDENLAAGLLAASPHLEEDADAHRYEHSVEVQVPFLQYLKPDVKIVPIVIGHEQGDILQTVGRDIAGVLKETGQDALIIASGDMTHQEPDKTARRKDQQAIDAILSLDASSLLQKVQQLHITMCGHGPAACLIAAVNELGGARAELVKYTTSGETTGDYDHVVGYAGIIIKKAEPVTALARRAVELYVKKGETLRPGSVPTEMRRRAGVFVTLYKHGELRGCIGTIFPDRENIAGEIIANGQSSATRDPRFDAVTEDELAELDYKVDVLTDPVPVDSEAKLDPKKYGVIVEAGYRRGLLLPDLEGVDSVAEQIDICRRKAGISPKEPVKLYRFEVVRYEE
jgi:MEMO1 family protein